MRNFFCLLLFGMIFRSEICGAFKPPVTLDKNADLHLKKPSFGLLHDMMHEAEHGAERPSLDCGEPGGEYGNATLSQPKWTPIGTKITDKSYDKYLFI